MKPFFGLLSVLFFSAWLFFQCDNTPMDSQWQPPQPSRTLTQTEMQLGQASNAFGIQLFQLLTMEKLSEGENIFVSPLSISLALSLALNGANGSTFEAIRSTLKLEDMTLQEINTSYSSLIDLLMRVDPTVMLQIANGLFFHQEFRVKEPFIRTLKKYYAAEVQAMNFGSPLAVQIINNWINTRTNGLIPVAINRIRSDEVLFLINAIYFKGNWTHAFDPERTADSPFFLMDGRDVMVPTMYRKAVLGYLNTPLGRVIDLPYGNKRFSMTIFLPHATVSLRDVLPQLSLEKWYTFFERLDSVQMELFLPKFTSKYSINLNTLLTAMGMEAAFNPNKADFSGISNQKVVLTRVNHTSFIQVDEKGTEAAGVTAIGIGIVSQPPVVRVNRPFVFLIRETTSNTILFMGVVLNPARS